MNILLTKNYGLGNQILCTPLIRVLHSMGHRLTVVSEYVGIDVLAGHPAITALHRWFPGHQENESVILNELGKQRFDIGIASVAVHGTSPDKFLSLCTRVINYGGIEGVWTRHEADLNLDYARELGWKGTWEQSELFIPDQVDAEAEYQAAHVFEPGCPVVGFHFGCVNHWNWRYKKWALENHIDTMVKLVREHNAYIVLCGGPDERNEADQVVRSMDPDVASRTLDTVKKLNIKQTGAFIRQCDVFVSNDSGLMHMAAAVGTPVVAIFGMSSEVKNAPWIKPDSNMSSIVKTDLWCRPCYGTERHGMCRRGDCLGDIKVDEVYQAVLGHLSSRPLRRQA